MAKMEYYFSDSEYRGHASNGTIVCVDESEFAEVIRAALSDQGISPDDEAYAEAYQREKDHLLEADEWVDLIGNNPLVTAGN